MASFARVAEDARAWLKSPEADRFEVLRKAAGEATSEVPEARRADWEKLLAGFAKESDPRRKERVEGLVRACRLFATSERKARLDEEPLAWDDPLDRIAGIGKASRDALEVEGVRCVSDLLWTLPTAFEDLRAPLTIAEAIVKASDEDSPRVCVTGCVQSATLVPMRGRRSVRVVLKDPDGKPTLHLWWFFPAHGVLASAKVDQKMIVVGRLRVEKGKPARMIHPDLVIDSPENRVVRARYPRLGVGEATVRKAVASALIRTATLPDPVPAAIAARENMPPLAELFREVHGAAGKLAERPSDASRRALRERLAWGEAFTRVWERLGIEAGNGAKALILPIDRAVLARLRAELGFRLTASQERTIATISKELARPVPMRRLLLGDVGTGKTVVALAAAAQCVAAGAQVAILAPTSVLAEQYMDAVAPLARATGASIVVVTAGQSAAERRRTKEQLEAGQIAIAVGTHALLREELRFKRLALVVVDEQHRLGVAQRLALVAKGARPHLLTLSATPIPRTLALALRGELATSVLDERPAGRIAVETAIVSRDRMDLVIAELRAACERGERAFFISPRIEIDAEDDAADPSLAVVARAEELTRDLAPFKVALIHGGLPQAAKSAAMRAFRSGEAQVLVGTTVVEVGVDVPEATRMVIDGADRFGLAQLHQMRGRVGRGDRPGRCLLLSEEDASDLAKRRLNALCTLSSGADVARADLELRGAGDLRGTRQSGAEEELLYLDPADPPAFLERIEKDAKRIFRTDPLLAKDAHRALSLMLRKLALAIAVREEAG